MKVYEIVDKAFSKRRGHGGSKRIVHRQMTREELARWLSMLRDAERKRAAEIAAKHADDDERGARALALAISEEIQAA
jgi:hypothetical protein